MKKLPNFQLKRPQVSTNALIFMVAVFVLLLGGAAFQMLQDFPFNGNPMVWLQAKEHFSNGVQARKRFNTTEALARFTKANAVYPNDPKFQFGLGETLERQRKYSEAEAAYKLAIALDKNYTEAWFRLGKVLSFQNKTNEALDATRAALKTDPDHAPSQAQLALLLAYKGLSADAEKAFDSTRQLERDDAEYWFLAGQYYRFIKKEPEAVAAFRQAAQKSPDEPEYSEWLGLSLFSSGHIEEALDWLDRATKLDPNPANYWGNLADCHLRMTRYDKAAIALQNAIDSDKDNVEFKKKLALVYYNDRKFDLAQPLLQSLLLKFPKDHNYRSALVNTLMAQHKYADAEKLLKVYVAEPEQSKAFQTWVFLAGSQQWQGKNAEAKTSYQHALSLKPPDQAKTKILAVMKSLEKNPPK